MACQNTDLFLALCKVPVGVSDRAVLYAISGAPCAPISWLLGLWGVASTAVASGDKAWRIMLGGFYGPHLASISSIWVHWPAFIHKAIPGCKGAWEMFWLDPCPCGGAEKIGQQLAILPYGTFYLHSYWVSYNHAFLFYEPCFTLNWGMMGRFILSTCRPLHVLFFLFWTIFPWKLWFQLHGHFFRETFS